MKLTHDSLNVWKQSRKTVTLKFLRFEINTCETHFFMHAFIYLCYILYIQCLQFMMTISAKKNRIYMVYSCSFWKYSTKCEILWHLKHILLGVTYFQWCQIAQGIGEFCASDERGESKWASIYMCLQILPLFALILNSHWFPTCFK